MAVPLQSFACHNYSKVCFSMPLKYFVGHSKNSFESQRPGHLKVCSLTKRFASELDKSNLEGITWVMARHPRRL